jgi:nucleoside-triphosphatase THEP1
MKISLTGNPGVGKSTILQTIQHQHDFVGCIVKECKAVDSKRYGFDLHYLDSHEYFPLARKYEDFSNELRMGNYNVNMDEIENKMIPFMDNLSQQNSKSILFDEIGKMQNLSPHFINAIDQLLMSNNNILFTVTLDENETWARKYKDKEKFFTLTITLENRNYIPKLLLLMLKSEKIPTKELLNKFNEYYENSEYEKLYELFE